MLAPEGRRRCWEIVGYAVASRLLAVVLGVASNAIIGDYDVSAETVLPLHTRGSYFVPILRRLAKASLRWDSFYFVHIADAGYVYEQEHAFFPLLPMLMRGLSMLIGGGDIAQHYQTLALVVSGLVISNAAFVLAASTLYQLGCATLRNERLAYVSALLFVAGPANAFMSAGYTESLFAWLVFRALLLVSRRQHLQASLWLGVASLCRSTGLLYAGFIVWDLMVESRREQISSLLAASSSRVRCLLQILARAVQTAGLVVISGLGLFAFQAYGRDQLCSKANGSVPPRPYCTSQVLKTPYSYVQEAYWDVGFLRYYTVQQLPNFALAAPMLLLSASGICAYVAHDPRRIVSLGWKSVADDGGFFGHLLLPHVYLWAVLLAVAATAMHVQVVTRFFSALPVVFWYAAHAALKTPWAGRAVAGYFVGYGLAGAVLFGSFFPPA